MGAVGKIVIYTSTLTFPELLPCLTTSLQISVILHWRNLQPIAKTPFSVNGFFCKCFEVRNLHIEFTFPFLTKVSKKFELLSQSTHFKEVCIESNNQLNVAVFILIVIRILKLEIENLILELKLAGYFQLISLNKRGRYFSGYLNCPNSGKGIYSEFNFWSV